MDGSGKRLTLTSSNHLAATLTYRLYIETPTQQAMTLDVDGAQAEAHRNVTGYVETDGAVVTATVDPTDTADAVTEAIGAGTDALSTLLSLEESENGLIVAEPDGTLNFQGRHHRLLNSAAPILTLGEAAADIPYRDPVALEDDDTRIANIVSVPPLNGTAVTVEDTASQDLYWKRRLNRTLLTSDATIASDAAYYLLGRYADPTARIPYIEPVMVKATAQWPKMLAAGNSDRVQWTRAATTPLDEDAFIEQISETVIPNTDWRIGLQLSPATDEAGWVLDDPVLSILDSTTVPVY